MKPAARLLKLLGLERQPPSLEFLKEITNRFLIKVPYENVSKLMHLRASGPTLPTFEEYVHGLESQGFGGTCFASNLHLRDLLRELDYNAGLLGVRRDHRLQHAAIKVKVQNQNYFVDLGCMTAFAGPYSLKPGDNLESWQLGQKFVFQPQVDGENYYLEIHRDGKLIRSFRSSSHEVTTAELDEAVRRTFDPKAMFMSHLVIYRCLGDFSAGVWDKTFYRTHGMKTFKRELANVEELATTVETDLNLPHYPLKEALQIMKAHANVDPFAPPIH